MIEQEIFRYKEVIDNAIVIFLENDKCWKNYIKRENKKLIPTSYNTLTKKEYQQMVQSFTQNYKKLYKHSTKVQIKNDEKSWKRVYDEIKWQIESKRKIGEEYQDHLYDE